jgi:hypothetical protein
VQRALLRRKLANGWYGFGGFFILCGLLSIFYSIWSTYWAADKNPGFTAGGAGIFFLMLGFILLIIGAEVDKRKDPAFMARREKRWRYKQNARRKGKRV